MHPRSVSLLVALLTLSVGSAKAASITPAQKCIVAKLKAAAKEAQQKINCHIQAVTAGVEVSDQCLVTAEDKLLGAFQKAETAGGCERTNNAEAMDAVVQTFAEDAVAVAALPPPKQVFVSSETYDGNLGGLPGADAKCQTLATAAGLTGTFKAWLSTGTTTATSRLTHSDGPYALVDNTKIANNWSDLTDGSLLHAIDQDENGDTSTAIAIWTGTTPTGDKSTPNCLGWTFNTDSSKSGRTGTLAADQTWTDNNATEKKCNSLQNLYCIEQ